MKKLHKHGRKNLFKIDFIGIGAKKSATSWLARCLSEHPEICMPRQKEIHFFSSQRRYEKGLSFYESHFLNCSESSVKGEFSTSYFSSEKAFYRIKKYYPDVKIILILREPVERAVSHFKHLISKGKISKNADIKDAISENKGILTASKYTESLKRWFNFFDKENILILFYDDINREPKKVLRDVFSFLGVNIDFISKSVGQKMNSSKTRMSPFFRPINKLYLKLRKNKVGMSLIKIFRFLKFSILKNFLFSFSNNKSIKITREDKRYLLNLHKKDIEDLEGLLNKDLSNWKRL